MVILRWLFLLICFAGVSNLAVAQKQAVIEKESATEEAGKEKAESDAANPADASEETRAAEDADEEAPAGRTH